MLIGTSGCNLLYLPLMKHYGEQESHDRQSNETTAKSLVVSWLLNDGPGGEYENHFRHWLKNFAASIGLVAHTWGRSFLPKLYLSAWRLYFIAASEQGAPFELHRPAALPYTDKKQFSKEIKYGDPSPIQQSFLFVSKLCLGVQLFLTWLNTNKVTWYQKQETAHTIISQMWCAFSAGMETHIFLWA